MGRYSIRRVALGVYNPRDLREMSGLAQEMQLEINTLLLDCLPGIENNDHARFGKIRIAMERDSGRNDSK